MSLLDEVIKMKSQGYTDEQITQMLKEKNIPPKEISQALDQSNIKKAVDQENVGPNMEQSILTKPTQEIPAPEQVYQNYPNQLEQPQQDIFRLVMGLNRFLDPLEDHPVRIHEPHLHISPTQVDTDSYLVTH